GREIPCLLDGSVAVAQQAAAAGGEVKEAVAVDVRYCHRGGPARGEGAGVLEGAVAVAQEHADRAVGGDIVGHGEVGSAVAVELPHRHGSGASPYGEMLRRLEGAVAVAPQHAHGVARKVGDGEVGSAVAVELP